jgi:hypothetical protein
VARDGGGQIMKRPLQRFDELVNKVITEVHIVNDPTAWTYYHAKSRWLLVFRDDTYAFLVSEDGYEGSHPNIQLQKFTGNSEAEVKLAFAAGIYSKEVYEAHLQQIAAIKERDADRVRERELKLLKTLQEKYPGE